MASIDPTKTLRSVFYSPVGILINVLINLQIDAYDVNENHMSTTNSTFEVVFLSCPDNDCSGVTVTQPANSGAGIYTASFQVERHGIYQYKIVLSADPGYDGNAGALPQDISGSPYEFTALAPPVITCPLHVLASVASVPATVSLGTATAVDAEDGSLTPTNNAASGGYPLGVHTVVWSATDSSGLTSTCEQSVTVQGCAAVIVNVASQGNPVSGMPVHLVTYDCGNNYATAAEILDHCPDVNSGLTVAGSVSFNNVLPDRYLAVFPTTTKEADTRPTNVNTCQTVVVNFST